MHDDVSRALHLWSVVCRRTTKREIKSNRSPRARLIEKKNSLYLSRLSRCLGSTSPWWSWCLFFFVRVLPFLCKERESVSMSAPKAQTSRFERDKKRERERDDDDVSSLLCFCAHEKTRDPKRSPKRGRRRNARETVFLTDILCACV